MQQYPYNSAQILTDDIFTSYGGKTGTSTALQRQAMYLIAEEQMTQHLNSFLVETQITGTHFCHNGLSIELDYGHILHIDAVTIASVDWNNSCTVYNATGCYAVRNAEYGYLDVGYLCQCGGCGSVVKPPYNVQVVYTSGLSTGTSSSPKMLQALTIAAQINLNEIDPQLSNESTGDIGITQFSNQQYSEVRMKMVNTAFGNSPLAQRIKRLVDNLRSKPSVRFR